MESDFNIESNSIIPNFDVVYASGKNQFVFFGNKLYKYNVNFTINDNMNFYWKTNINFTEKKIEINLKINSQSMISIYNSILLVTYVYQNSNKNFIFQKFMIILHKIHELQNFLKTLKFNNNISYVYVDNSNFITVLKN